MINFNKIYYMKAKIYKKLLIVSIVLTIAFASVSCKDNLDLSLYYSQVRSGIYKGEVGEYSITVYSEEREEPFIIDGFVGEMKKVLTVKLNSNKNSVDGASIILSYDNYECEGEFSYNPINGKYVAEIFVDKLPKCAVLSAVFKCEGESNELQLQTQVNNETISCDKAIESVKKHDGDKIKSKFSTTNVSTEIHIRILSDGNKNYYFASSSVSAM